MKKTPRLLYSILLLCLLSSCHRQVSQQDEFSAHEIERSIVDGRFYDHHFGILIKYIDAEDHLFAYQANHLFTPASNMKLLTYLAAVTHIPDQVPWMKVATDSLGTHYYPLGDPGYSHPEFLGCGSTIDYWRARHDPGDTIHICRSHDLDQGYGPGWAWDDYPYAFQAARSTMPIHGNLLHIEASADSLRYDPAWIDIEIIRDTTLTRPMRHPHANVVRLPSALEGHYDIPVTPDDSFLASHFEALGFHVRLDDSCPTVDADQIHMGARKDTLLSFMMKYSDNFIAEQLLRQCGVMMGLPMHSSRVIDSLLESVFTPWQEGIRWHDGSGLSRYNQLSPAAVVGVIEAIIKADGIEAFCRTMPAGGQSGTIASYYAYDPPRVFAKTGTLKHCHNLSGVCQTRSGRWVVFSMMNNHLRDGTLQSLKSHMSAVIRNIIDLY